MKQSTFFEKNYWRRAGLRANFFVLPALLLALLVVGMMLTPTAAAQGGEPPTLTVLAEALNIRSGPDASYPAFDTLAQGTTTGIIGYNAQTGWWQVVSRFGSPGWVSGRPEYVSVTGDVAGVPGAAADESDNNNTIHNSQLAIRNSQPGTIVFQTASGGPIYAVNPDGTNLRYLTTGMDPAISPDGQQVAFTRWETSQDGALGSLWLIDIDGTGERVIHEYVYNPRAPVWSADGSQIAISFQSGGRVQPERTCGNQRPPRNAYDVSISREGEERDKEVEFCYTRPADPHWGLRLVNVVTGQHQDLPGDTYSLSPAWNPGDSGHLVYDGDRGLVNLNLAENKTWPLTEDFNDHSPVFSPDGSKIAVSYRQDDHWEVHVMSADGSNRQRLTQTSYLELVRQELRGKQPHSHNNAAPVWSPDGTQLAFLTDRSGNWEIWLMNADGSNQRPLLPAEALTGAGISLQYNGADEQSLSWR